MHFVKKLKNSLRVSDSHLCIGLDTDINKIPKFLLENENPVFMFNSLIIEAASDLVCAFKINIAFYENLGDNGWQILKDTVKSIPENIITIADAKRGDIENTSELYAKTFFDKMNFDSITIHPYMGSDSVRPFIRRKNKFVFLLILTSNFGSKDFQFLKVGNKKLYEIVIEKAKLWNELKIGYVIGANHFKELNIITKENPGIPVLIPGIGSQKNSLTNTIHSIDHNLFLINQSRSIIYSADNAQNSLEFKEIIRQNVIKARDEINNLIAEKL